MKNDFDKVAQTIANEIEKFEANAPADHGTFHKTLKLTKRQSEARQMAGWFLINVEKMTSDDDDDKEKFNKLQNALIDAAIEIVGK